MGSGCGLDAPMMRRRLAEQRWRHSLPCGYSPTMRLARGGLLVRGPQDLARVDDRDRMANVRERDTYRCGVSVCDPHCVLVRSMGRVLGFVVRVDPTLGTSGGARSCAAVAMQWRTCRK